MQNSLYTFSHYPAYLFICKNVFFLNKLTNKSHFMEIDTFKHIRTGVGKLFEGPKQQLMDGEPR